MHTKPVFILYLTSALLAIFSVLGWLLYSLRLSVEWLGVFHLISSIQGFYMCLVCALVLSVTEKVTNHTIQKKTLIVLPSILAIGVSATAFFRNLLPFDTMLAISEGSWLILALILFVFIYKKMGRFMTPAVKAWLISAFVFGLTGAIFVSLYSLIDIIYKCKLAWLLFLGRGYLLQLMVLSLILALCFYQYDKTKGVDQSSIGLVLLGVGVLGLSIPIEFFISDKAGLLIRAMLGLLLFSKTKILAWPRNKTFYQKGYARICFWIVCGYGIAALHPALRLAGLHVVFIGGFTLGAILLSLHLTDKDKQLTGHRYKMSYLLIESGFMLAMALRSLREMMPVIQNHSMALSTMTFMVSILIWIFSIKGNLNQHHTQFN